MKPDMAVSALILSKGTNFPFSQVESSEGDRSLHYFFLQRSSMVPRYSSSARSRFSTVEHSLPRHLHRFRSCLVAGATLFGLLLLSPASQFVLARGGTWHEFVYHGQAGSRPYFVYTPEDYRPGTPVPLLVMLHGCSQTAADFAAGTRMDELADVHNFIVVYPQQTQLNNPTT